MTLNGILFAVRIVFISARGRVGCSPDRTRKMLVGELMLRSDANKYIHNPLSGYKFQRGEDLIEEV